jgi:hypothetical protein
MDQLDADRVTVGPGMRVLARRRTLETFVLASYEWLTIFHGVYPTPKEVIRHALDV